MGRRSVRSGRGIVVLIVEDKDATRREWASVASRSFDVVEARTKAEALASLSAIRGRLAGLLLDYYLPDGTGVDVLEAAVGSGLRVPAVVISGGMPPAGAHRIERELRARFQPKPLDADRLEALLQWVASRSASLETQLDDAVWTYVREHDLAPHEAVVFAKLPFSRPPRIPHLADALGIPSGTVRDHLASIRARTGIGSVEELISDLLECARDPSEWLQATKARRATREASRGPAATRRRTERASGSRRRR